MYKPKKALLLIGSPKMNKSVSENLGMHILGMLRSCGLQTRVLNIARSVDSLAGRQDLVAHINECDMVILSCPLYVDSSPSFVIKALEIIAKNKIGAGYGGKGLLAIAHCGFPEAHQNQVALDIYHRFATELNFKWLGSLSFGMSPVINMRFLSVITRNVQKALEITAGAIIGGRNIPSEAVKLSTKPFMPIWIYTFVGNLMWRFLALKNGVLDIAQRPALGDHASTRRMPIINEG